MEALVSETPRLFRNIAVIGAGLMGHGIAQVFAAAGFPVAVHDAQPAALAALHGRIRGNLRALGLEEAIAERVRACADLAEAVRDADFVVEAVQEDLAVKQDMFARIERAAPEDAVLASNTSVIPITQIMSALRRRERALGTHWWNPPFLVPLVEVIGTEWTDTTVLARVMDLHRAVGQSPVHVRRDLPGFIGNRLQHALWREAIALVQDGVCDAATVDAVVKASFGRRLAVLGPLENSDLVGSDLTLAAHRVLLAHLDRTPGPLKLLEDLVASGRLGMKSGEGFRAWSEADQAALRARLVDHLLDLRRHETATGHTAPAKSAG